MINFNKGSKQGFRSFGLNGVSFVSEISNEQQVRLMFILGKVLSTLPLEAIVASLNRVVGPCVEDLRSLCAAPEADATTKGQLMTRLKMIATLCTTLDVRATGGSESDDDSAHSRQSRHSPATSQQPVLLIAQQLLPYLKGVIDRWGADEQITEASPATRLLIDCDQNICPSWFSSTCME